LKPKVHKLSIESEYKLIGIASHLSTHKISWLFNQEMDAKFQQSDSLMVSEKGANEAIKFSIYKYEDVGDVLYTLFTNKAEQSNLIKSIKKIDYVLKCEGFMSDNLFQKYLKKIKKLKNILTAFEIDVTLLKNKEKEFFN